jgi:hypothetical protein
VRNESPWASCQHGRPPLSYLFPAVMIDMAPRKQSNTHVDTVAFQGSSVSADSLSPGRQCATARLGVTEWGAERTYIWNLPAACLRSEENRTARITPTHLSCPGLGNSRMAAAPGRDIGAQPGASAS